jgi:hypothetical protein
MFNPLKEETHFTMPETGRKIHERAEQILTPLLAAQGRDPDSYTSDEYVQACEQADRELNPRPEVEPEPDWMTRRQHDDAIAGWVMATLEAEGGEITATRYIAEFERSKAEVESMRAMSAEKEKLTLEERVARLERRLSSP